MSLLEALSYGNTCLVSDIPENTSIINDSSFSFKKSDVEDLKNKLIEILDKNILSHENKYIPYSWDYVVNKTLEKYKYSGNMSR
jgi:glycosyltransferase involved in cell wall biosynthesis